jgi:ribose-phosphate pyrophosphokinase
VILFSTASYAPFGRRLSAALGAEWGQIERSTFPDGERYHRILTPPERQTVLVGGTVSDDETLELFDLAYGLIDMGAADLTICVPYYGYSTMERAVKPGEVVKAKTRAVIFSSLPARVRLMFLDLHTEGLPYYFEAHLRTRHLYAKSVIIEACRELGGEDFVLASTDSGRAAWVASLSREIGCDAGFAYKRRSGAQTSLVGINADVRGRVVVVYDDMIRTGGSLIDAAGAYRDAGAEKVFAVATHGVLPANALEKLRASGALNAVAVTDSHPRVEELGTDEFFSVRSVTGIFAAALLNSKTAS